MRLLNIKDNASINAFSGSSKGFLVTHMCSRNVMHPVVHRWTSHIQDGGEKMEYVRLAVMVIGSSVPIKTTDAYWVLQRRLLPHAEQCSWWMGQICDSQWSVEEALMDAMHMLGILYTDQGRLEEAEAMFQQALQGK